MVMCYPATPARKALTAAMFFSSAGLFYYGLGLYYDNIGPQQARIQARNEFVRERLKKRKGEFEDL